MAEEADRVSTSPGGKLVSVSGADGFWALRVNGAWTDSPPFKITVGDLADFDPVTDENEASKLANAARTAASSMPVSAP